MKIKLFENIQIQTCSWCNLKCSFCPNSHLNRPKEFMKIEIYNKILNDLKDLDFQGRISPFLMNEPLLDPRLPELIKTTRKQLPKAHIKIDTNGTLLRKDKLTGLLNSGIDEIFINCYSGEHEYNKMKNLIKSLNANNIVKMRLVDQDVIQKFYNRGGNIDLSPLQKRSKYNKLGKRLFVRRCLSYLKRIILNSFPKQDNSYNSCAQPFIQMFINYLGKAVLCCSDWKYEVIIGDVSKENLLDIWNNKKYKKYRHHLLKGNRKGLKLCKDCDIRGSTTKIEYVKSIIR